jgi:hypothetical protein
MQRHHQAKRGQQTDRFTRAKRVAYRSVTSGPTADHGVGGDNLAEWEITRCWRRRRLPQGFHHGREAVPPYAVIGASTGSP